MHDTPGIGDMVERPRELAPSDEASADGLSRDERSERRMADVDDVFRRGVIRDMECLMILNRLDECGGNRTRAAGTLGISVRTLRNKLRDYRARGILER